MFHNRNVILIGPAPHIIETRRDLSVFDIVCRVNHTIHDSKLNEVIGDRCDVWYAAETLTEKERYCSLAGHIRYVHGRAITVHPKHRHKSSQMTGQEIFKNTGVPYRGMRAMADILSNNPESLCVTGFTFYDGKAYHDDYFGKEKPNQGNLGNSDQQTQIRLFMEHFAPKIIPDPQLASLMRKWAEQI